MNDLTDRLITRINELEARLSRLESSDRKLGDIQMTLGDTAGANKLSLRDSTPAEVFAVDSDGKVITELVVTGTTSSTAKAFDNFRIGIEAGTPRITIEDNSYTQWQIDNSLGQFRIFNPGVVQMTLNTSGNLAATGNVSGVLGTFTGGVAVPRSSGTALYALDVANTGSALTLANNAVGNPFGTGSVFSGLLLISETAVDGVAALYMCGGLATVLIAESVAGYYSITSGTASRTNVYYSPGSPFTFNVENKRGGSRTYNIMALRARASS